VQLDRSAVADHTHGAVNDVLQNRLQPPATDLDLHGSQMAAGDDFLPERAQQVEGEHAAQQHDPVHAKLAGGQLLDVEVALQLAVELFAGAVIMVKCAHFGRRTGQVRPIGVHFDGGDEQPHPLRTGKKQFPISNPLKRVKSPPPNPTPSGPVKSSFLSVMPAFLPVCIA
jgi:hypothetical protein